MMTLDDYRNELKLDGAYEWGLRYGKATSQFYFKNGRVRKMKIKALNYFVAENADCIKALKFLSIATKSGDWKRNSEINKAFQNGVETGRCLLLQVLY